MTFVVKPLLDGRFLVKGTDSVGTEGQTILRSERWAAVLHARTHKLATEDFNALVHQFFAPLTEAADKARAALDTSHGFGTVTISEGVEGVEGQEIELDEHGILLNIIEQTGGASLLWVNDELVAVAE